MDYGIIGNNKTAALVKSDGSIDWLCYPRFDSPSIFGKLLDDDAGSFGIRGNYKTSQQYIENTNVLETHFSNGEDEFVAIDFFAKENLFRILRPLKGRPKLSLVFNPRPDYARSDGKLSSENFILFDKFAMFTNLDNSIVLSGSEFELKEEIYFSVGKKKKYYKNQVNELLLKTISYWQNYIQSFNLPRELEDKIARSLLVLKLLTYQKTGAMLAAATTSIPEIPGEERNWDYRFCWIRDGSFAADIFAKLGSTMEAQRFINFIYRSFRRQEVIQIMYGIGGETMLEEFKLNHLRGFKNSRPVRIGNAAYYQDQFDIAGEFLALVWKLKVDLNEDQLKFVKYLVEYAIDRLGKKDQGIWEIRYLHEHFTFSKLMCWVAIDRGIKIARYYNKAWAIDEWIVIRDQLREEILEKAWNGKAFGMYYGSDDLDSAVLLMPRYGFIDANDSRFISTLDEVDRVLAKDELLLRYSIKDDFGYMQTSFTISSFWYVEALHMSGETEKAKKMFEKLCSYSNHLGLFSEGIDFESKELLGNFPQAYSHIGLVNAAIQIYRGKNDS